MNKLKIRYANILSVLALCLILPAALFGQSRFTTLQTDVQSFTTTVNSAAQRNVRNFAVEAVVTVNTPTAKTFTATAATDLLTTTAHGYETGLKGQASTTTTLPAGLATTTDYFVIRIDADNYKLATSLANALAGTAIDITNTGTGTHTFTPTALAGGTVKLQGSVNCTDFADIASTSQNITATGNFIWTLADQGYQCVRTQTTLTAGMMKATVVYSPAPSLGQ